MGDLTYGLFVRGQYHAGDDMRKRFGEVKAQVRLADQLLDTMSLFAAKVMPKVAQAL